MVAVVCLILETNLGACHIARVNELVHAHLLPHRVLEGQGCSGLCIIVYKIIYIQTVSIGPTVHSFTATQIH